MIKFNNQVPSIYPSASRDFQYLSWLIDIVLNSVKHNVDDLYDLPNTKADARLTELLAMTLGFKVKRNYDQKQLAALVAVLPRILKYKGTKTALDIAGNALIGASGAIGSFFSEVVDGELEVILPRDLVDISLFTDLLPYILPAGLTCHIVRANRLRLGPSTKVNYQEGLRAKAIPYLDWDRNKVITGLAKMYDIPNTQELTFANFIEPNTDTETDLTLNAGLLNNSIIPKLNEPLVNISDDTATESDGGK